MENLQILEYNSEIIENQEKQKFEEDLQQIGKDMEFIKQINLDLNQLIQEQDKDLGKLEGKMIESAKETEKTVEILKDAAKIQGKTWKMKLMAGFTTVGSAIGAIAGPVGIAIGGSVGLVAGKVLGKKIEKQNNKDLENI